MKRSWLCLLLALLFAVPVFTQKLVIQSPYKKDNPPSVPGTGGSDHEAMIRMQVDRLFAAMRAADTTMLQGLFIPDARLITAGADERNPAPYSSTPIHQFIASVGRMQPGVINEVIFNTEVKVDGALANVWSDYVLYANGNFIHCGVDVFELVQVDGKWLITTIHDTRRKEPCPDDPYVAVNALLDGWHRAAAEADASTYFNSIAEDGVFLGTDASERWDKAAFWTFCKPYFDQKKVWDFKPSDRHVNMDHHAGLAWFDEQLDTWMGKCRGSGVLTRTADGWKIKQYNLTILVPNDVVNDYLKLLSNK